MQTDVTFIGLGNMGLPMALNLVKAGFTVAGFDLVPANLNKLVAAGGIAANTPMSAASNSRVVITMLPAGKHVEQVYLGENGILANVKPGTLLIDCSTISPASARKVAAAAAESELSMIDAPVSGGTGGAQAGTLTFMVGGAAEALNAARPYLEKMGKAIFHAGGNGSGQTVKVCNNMLLGILMAGTCEAIRLGMANGMDPKILSEIMAKSSGRNWVLEVYNPCPGVAEDAPAARGYAGGFGVNLMLKDLTLATENAASTGARVPLGELVKDLYDMHGKAGAGELDFSSIFGLYAQQEMETDQRTRIG
jgi:3-hydroxyisobutyrate dehydrogenase